MTTVDSIRELASLIHSIRPGWDLTATLNQLLARRDIPVDLLTAAAVRCANDSNNRTPAALGWMELGSPEREDPTRKLKGPICYICGRTRQECWEVRDWELRRNIPDPHEFETSEQADRNSSQRQMDARARAKATAAEARRTQARDMPYLPPDLAANEQVEEPA